MRVSRCAPARSLSALAIALLAGCGAGGGDCPPGGPPCGTTTDVTRPAAVASAQTFATISIGNWHACMASTTGAAWCWGSNDAGQLGAASAQRCMGGNIDCSAAPLEVGGMHAFATLASSEVHTCGLTAAGQAWCWGLGAGLGNGGPVGAVQPTPVAVGGGLHFTHLAAGNNRSCGLTADGSAWCWGEGYGGALGDGSTAQRLTPVAVADGHHFAAIASGGISTCGIDTAGKAWCWGSNDTGAVGVPMP